MSTSTGNFTVVQLFRHQPGWTDGPQSHSWPTWLRRLLRATDKARQRAALRALASNRHLLDDIGLSQREALGEADRPFWQ